MGVNMPIEGLDVPGAKPVMKGCNLEFQGLLVVCLFKNSLAA